MRSDGRSGVISAEQSEAPRAISFSQKLEEKSREAEGINAMRALDRQQPVKSPEREAI